jgi:hypothetical protein
MREACADAAHVATQCSCAKAAAGRTAKTTANFEVRDGVMCVFASSVSAISFLEYQLLAASPPNKKGSEVLPPEPSDLPENPIRTAASD